MMNDMTPTSARKLTHAAVLAALLLFAVTPAHPQQLPAMPDHYVVDLARVIDRSTAARLDGFLQELERKTGTQMIVLTVHSTDGVPIRRFALETAEKWKLGQAGKDNGALIAVAVGDRKWTIETGYGVEGVLPDLICSRVGREIFVPHFRKGQYGQGLYQGTLVLANHVASEAGVTIEGMPAQVLRPRSASRKARGVGAVGSIMSFLPLIILVLILRSRRRYRTGGMGSALPWMILGGTMMGGRRHSGWGGGGFSSGGFGGGGFGGGFGGGTFGGGGGGSFGGGGASGGW